MSICRCSANLTPENAKMNLMKTGATGFLVQQSCDVLLRKCRFYCDFNIDFTRGDENVSGNAYTWMQDAILLLFLSLFFSEYSYIIYVASAGRTLAFSLKTLKPFLNSEIWGSNLKETCNLQLFARIIYYTKFVLYIKFVFIFPTLSRMISMNL